jgi:hypothetical protein
VSRRISPKHREAKALKGRTIRFERAELCWPLLFHVEPLLSAYQWKTGVSVIVTDDEGTHEYATVAEAEAAVGDDPPHRVEMYATYDGDQVFKIGLWVVGFAPDERPAVTIHIDQGMESQAHGLQESVAEFLSDEDPAAAAQAPVPARGRWHWLTEQPLGVTIVGGVVAALVAAGIIALVTLLVR